MTITLPLPIGEIVSVRLVSIYPQDGAHGSVTFDALAESGAVVGQPARGALFAEEPTAETLGEVALNAAVLALHDE